MLKTLMILILGVFSSFTASEFCNVNSPNVLKYYEFHSESSYSTEEYEDKFSVDWAAMPDISGDKQNSVYVTVTNNTVRVNQFNFYLTYFSLSYFPNIYINAC